MIDKLVNWLNDWIIEWLINWLNDWLFRWLVDWLMVLGPMHKQSRSLDSPAGRIGLVGVFFPKLGAIVFLN